MFELSNSLVQRFHILEKSKPLPLYCGQKDSAQSACGMEFRPSCLPGGCTWLGKSAASKIMHAAMNVTVCHDKEVGEREEEYLCTELSGRP